LDGSLEAIASARAFAARGESAADGGGSENTEDDERGLPGVGMDERGAGSLETDRFMASTARVSRHDSTGTEQNTDHVTQLMISLISEDILNSNNNKYSGHPLPTDLLQMDYIHLFITCTGSPFLMRAI
jgi:hypothetical protein